MKFPNSKPLNVIGWLVAILVPLALLLSALRFALTPVFVNLEYHTPGFPEDSYGMTPEERLSYAPLALDYLLNDEDISFLADQTFADGSPLYNARELSHMEDVKTLTQQVLDAWLLALGVLLALGLWAWRAAWLGEFKLLLSRGGLVTLYLIAAIGLFAAFSFDSFFTSFHGLFFEGNTWLFLFSDTLIRLFPIRFWRDLVILLTLLTVGAGALIWRVFRPRA
ncbi:MAG: TIGR01906 family membrane protein [Chloroflexi bacterium]|nr:TIGR01906 family membrane protein [Chloroflexota bacterium]